jgi:hypothetical protein
VLAQYTLARYFAVLAYGICMPLMKISRSVILLFVKLICTDLDENENVRYIGQGEARHRKYKRLKLGVGHVYDRSSV